MKIEGLLNVIPHSLHHVCEPCEIFHIQKEVLLRKT
jgi:hypothetical protein